MKTLFAALVLVFTASGAVGQESPVEDSGIPPAGRLYLNALNAFSPPGSFTLAADVSFRLNWFVFLPPYEVGAGLTGAWAPDEASALKLGVVWDYLVEPKTGRLMPHLAVDPPIGSLRWTLPLEFGFGVPILLDREMTYGYSGMVGLNVNYGTMAFKVTYWPRGQTWEFTGHALMHYLWINSKNGWARFAPG